MKKKLLLVVGMGGPPMDFALPKVADIASVHLLSLMDLAPAKREFCNIYASTVDFISDGILEEEDLAGTISAFARSKDVDAILTFSEYAIVPVSQACIALGLKGPGKNTFASHNKVEMRERWREARLPSPKHYSVRNVEELVKAASILGTPFVFKDANGAGGIGCTTVDEKDDLPAMYWKSRITLEEAFAKSKGDYNNQTQQFEFIAEELIPGSTDGWYGTPGFADFISVEGVVKDGEYFPLAITSRIKSLPPFTETGTFSPAPIPEKLEKEIVELSRVGVNALQLENCATHTEIKLKKEGGAGLLESAARIGGMSIARQTYAVWGVDIVSTLVKILLGEEVDIPRYQCVAEAKGAAAALGIIGANSQGIAWQTPLSFNIDLMDWGRLSGKDVNVFPEKMSLAPGSFVVQPYQPSKGALNFHGMLYMEARDSETLMKSCIQTLDNLGSHLG